MEKVSLGFPPFLSLTFLYPLLENWLEQQDQYLFIYLFIKYISRLRSISC